MNVSVRPRPLVQRVRMISTVAIQNTLLAILVCFLAACATVDATTKQDIGASLRGITSNIFGVGPEIAATTKVGRSFARYEFEFGAQDSFRGQVFVFGWAALWDPFK